MRFYPETAQVTARRPRTSVTRTTTRSQFDYRSDVGQVLVVCEVLGTTAPITQVWDAFAERIPDMNTDVVRQFDRICASLRSILELLESSELVKLD